MSDKEFKTETRYFAGCQNLVLETVSDFVGKGYEDEMCCKRVCVGCWRDDCKNRSCPIRATITYKIEVNHGNNTEN